MRVRLLIAALAVLAPASAHSQFVTGNMLLENCEDGRGTPNGGFCVGYIAGTADSARSRLCTPEGVTTGQLVAVVERYLETNPEYRHFSAAVVSEEAILDAFPCR